MKLGFETTPFVQASKVQIPDIFFHRMMTGIEEIDRVFGNGILPGCAFTLTAQPGGGKTTLMLQIFEALARQGYKVGYASGEENRYQLAFNCRRLGVKELPIANQTDIDELAKLTVVFDALVIDSYQTLTTKEHMPSTKKVERIISHLLQSAKNNECALFFIMHHTVDGKLKGGTEIPHAVDVNIEIIRDKEAATDAERIISFYKNRFGPTGKFVALMTSCGFDFSKMEKVAETHSKKNRKSKNAEKITHLTHITLATVQKEVGVTKQQAYNLLKTLVEQGTLVKRGAGAKAVWTTKKETKV